MINWLTKVRIGLAGGAIIAAMTMTNGLMAQTEEENSPPQTGLDIPADAQIFGKFDPNIRKPTAIVNDVVITGTDVDQRAALTVPINEWSKLNEQEMRQLRFQILRQLIDETLQIQEAKSNEITVTTDEINQGFNRVAANFNKSPADLKTYLRSVGSSEKSLRRQLEGQLAWSRLLRRRVEPLTNVSDEEVQSVLDSMRSRKGSEEYHLKEIYLSAGPERAQQVAAQEREMIDGLKKGEKPFEYYAQFTESTARATQGDLGWLSDLQLSQLPDSLSSAAREMKAGQIAGPIEVPGGFSILFMVDTRKVLEADPRDSKLTLKQISVHFAPGLTEADAKARLQEFADKTSAIKGCGDVARVATAMGAEVVDNASVTVRDLPPQLQKIMLEMQVGQSTPPFGSVDQGIRSLVLCGRDAPHEGNLPTASQVQDQMEQSRVNLRAQKMLRDLRRDAVIEYR